MLIVLSPAKNLDESPSQVKSFTLPRNMVESGQLITKLKTFSQPKLQKLMGVSKALTSLNKQRYLNYSEDHSLINSKPAIFTFMGDVYRGLDAHSLSNEGLKNAQSHLRILSGLYGILRPYDLIQPYRLEMGTKLAVRRKKNLYEFWGTKLADQINEDVIGSNSQYIINLASDEYWKAVDQKTLTVPVIKINFKEFRNGEYKFVSFNAKRARGLMARYLIEYNISKKEDILGFNTEDYAFNPNLSQDNSLIFTRE